MIANLLRSLVLLFMFMPAAHADSLPLPDNLIADSSPAGQELLIGADARQAYFTLANNYLTQKTQSFCGVASMVMVFNALQLPAPDVPEYAPYKTFTQDNVFNASTEAILPQADDPQAGHHPRPDGRPAGGSTGQCRGPPCLRRQPRRLPQRGSRPISAQPDHYVLINYFRNALGQQKGGHFSPLAAYDKETDRFLILDVARYKYPPVWVKAEELFAAMNTKDSDNDDKSRGYVLITRKQ